MNHRKPHHTYYDTFIPNPMVVRNRSYLSNINSVKPRTKGVPKQNYCQQVFCQKISFANVVTAPLWFSCILHVHGETVVHSILAGLRFDIRIHKSKYSVFFIPLAPGPPHSSIFRVWRHSGVQLNLPQLNTELTTQHNLMFNSFGFSWTLGENPFDKSSFTKS